LIDAGCTKTWSCSDNSGPALKTRLWHLCFWGCYLSRSVDLLVVTTDVLIAKGALSYQARPCVCGLSGFPDSGSANHVSGRKTQRSRRGRCLREAWFTLSAVAWNYLNHIPACNSMEQSHPSNAKVTRLVKKYPVCMEPEGSQQPAADPYPGPYESSPETPSKSEALCNIS
jgi:hypothetical protein